MLRTFTVAFIYKISVILVVSLFGAMVYAQSTPAAKGEIKPLIKAGTAMLANLNTTVSNDTQSKEIAVTVIDGKYTGAKLIGKLLKSDPSIIHFSSMRFKDKSIKTKRIDAYAIDFDAARIVLITDPDFDELKPKAAKMAKSLIASYSVAHKLQLGAGTDVGILFLANVS